MKFILLIAFLLSSNFAMAKEYTPEQLAKAAAKTNVGGVVKYLGPLKESIDQKEFKSCVKFQDQLRAHGQENDKSLCPEMSKYIDLKNGKIVKDMMVFEYLPGDANPEELKFWKTQYLVCETKCNDPKKCSDPSEEEVSPYQNLPCSNAPRKGVTWGTGDYVGLSYKESDIEN